MNKRNITRKIGSALWNILRVSGFPIWLLMLVICMITGCLIVLVFGIVSGCWKAYVGKEDSSLDDLYAWHCNPFFLCDAFNKATLKYRV